MAGYVSIFGGGGNSSAKAVALPTQRDSSGKQGYTSIFGGPTVQQATDDQIRQRNQQQARDAAAKQKADADAAAKAAQDRANNSIFGKVKTAAKAAVTDVVHTGEKALNTTAAGIGGTSAAVVAGVQKATGHDAAAQSTVRSANKNVDALLDHGLGNQGGYISSKDAVTSNPKAVIKGIAKGTADIAPLVIPAGEAVEGGSILARVATKVSPELETALRSEKLLPGVARAAVGNAAVGAGTDAANQVIDSGHVNLKQTGQAALEGGAFGAVMHGAQHGGASLFAKVRQNTLPEHVAQAHIDANGPDVPPATPGLPRPGEVIAPQPATARAEMLQEKPATVPSTPSVPLAHNGAIQPQPTLPFDRPVEGQLPIDAAASAKAGKPVPIADAPLQAQPVPLEVPKTTDGSTSSAGPKDVPSVHDTPKPVEAPSTATETERVPTHRAYGRDIEMTEKNGYEITDAADGSKIYSKVLKHGNNAKGTHLEQAWYDAKGNKLTRAQAEEKIGKPAEKPKSTSVTSKVTKSEPKPEPVDGFHTSDEMRQGHAQMLRDYDQQAKGGNKYELHENGAPNVGEKSPFYKQFFKENGKRPTKADYDAEAHKQLMKGEDKQTYTKLLEREGKISPVEKSDSPAPKPAAKTEAAPVKEATPPVEKPAGQGSDKGIPRTAASVHQRALEKGLERDYGQLAEYDKTTVKKQAAQATELLNGPRDDIEAILAGEKPLPEGLKASTFIKAVEEHPEYGHDPDMLRDLGRSDIHKQISTAAQELRLSRERNPNSSVEAIRQIDQIRKDSFKQKYGKTAERAQAEEVKAIQAAQPKLESNDWNDFIDSIKCPT